jgi:type IV secretory pathway TraG/TraD family ATPase VirD4
VYLDSKSDNWGWGDVWSIVSKDKKEIAKLLSSFEDGKALANVLSGDSKSTEDIYSTLVGHAQQTIRWYAKAWPQGRVSLRKWVHSDSKLLILGGTPERADLAQATANISIELIVNEILSLPDDPNRRIWLFLDELATLGKLTSLLNAFSLGRSKGLCVVAGIQDIGKLEHHYGPTLAKSITNTFSTQIILRCSDHVTAEWASKALGEQEVIITQSSRGSSSSDGKSSRSDNKQESLRTMSVFMPSQISNFENQEGVIRASGWPLLYVQWNYQPIPQTQTLLDEADWLKKKEKPFERKSEPPEDPPGHNRVWNLDN